MKHLVATACACTFAFIVLNSARTYATEPNQTFATATVLAPGVLTVADELTPTGQIFPDTYLGARNALGQVYLENDDDSELGDGRASQLTDVATNSGSINFSVTGFGDDNFEGSHTEVGQYRVFVEVYDFFGDLNETLTFDRTLAPGVVHNFMDDDADWIGGTYNVVIDNTIGATAGDLDFFKFTGLTPGVQFSTVTAAPGGPGIDTLLGWFDSEGTLIDVDDDDAGDMLSLIEGIVPGDGTLTFAVTGFGDDGFAGFHFESGSYELRLQLAAAGLPGDYNGNNVVDVADYVVWRDSLNQSGQNLPADGDKDGTVDIDDYGVWRSHFGQTAPASSSGATDSASGLAVPEPTTLGLALMLCGVFFLYRNR